MNTYEVTDLFEAGNADETIQTPKDCIMDEVGGNDGPCRESLEDE